MLLDLDSIAASLINAAPDAMFVVDVQGVILLANDQAEQLFLYRRDELVGRSIDMLVPDTLRASHASHRSAYDAAPRRRAMGAIEVAGRRRDGTEVWVDISLSPIEFAGRRLVISIARDVTERRRLHDQLRYLGSHDALTGLYNRGYFDEELARLQRGRVFPIAMVVVDLDGLKQINDAAGHVAGDAMLKQAAGVLRAAFRAEDVVARIGGDEFAVVLPNAAEDELKTAIERTRRCALAGGIAFSIGGAIARTGDEVERAVQLADRAMYVDKAARRGARAPISS